MLDTQRSAKPFKTVAEQVEILKSRGLKIEDDDSAKHYLLYNNYYNVINHYGRFFQSAPDKYIVGSTFNEIRYLYQFDKELKSLFFKASLDIEKNLKSLIAYYYSDAYRNPYPYLDRNNYQYPESASTSGLIALFSGLIQKYVKLPTDSAIKHYHACHGDVPLWVLTNEMSFGQTNNFYKRIPDHIRNEISKCFAFDYQQEYQKELNLSPDNTWKCLCGIQELRNTCGHNNRLLNHRFRYNLPYLPALYPEGYNSNSPRRSVYDTYLSMAIFMTKEQFDNLTRAIRKRMRNFLRNKIHSISYIVILQSLGFPDDWI